MRARGSANRALLAFAWQARTRVRAPLFVSLLVVSVSVLVTSCLYLGGPLDSSYQPYRYMLPLDQKGLRGFALAPPARSCVRSCVRASCVCARALEKILKSRRYCEIPANSPTEC